MPEAGLTLAKSANEQKITWKRRKGTCSEGGGGKGDKKVYYSPVSFAGRQVLVRVLVPCRNKGT